MRLLHNKHGAWGGTLAILAVLFFTVLPVLAIVPPASTDLPPDPGVAREETIEGVDSNANGVRDDLELAIFAAYPDIPNGTEDPLRRVFFFAGFYAPNIHCYRKTRSKNAATPLIMNLFVEIIP